MFQVGYNDNKKIPYLPLSKANKNTKKYKIIKDNIDSGFCIFSFPRMFVYLKSGIERKEPVYDVHWSLINKDNFKKYINFNHDCYSLIAGRLSGITIFDFDFAEDYYKLIKKHPELKRCKTIKTNKGYHIYFNYNPNIQTKVDAMVSYKKVDIRNNYSLAFCPPCKYTLLNGKEVEYKDLGGVITDIPEYLIKDLKQFKNSRVNTNRFEVLIL
jgi:hypothetical protein